MRVRNDLRLELIAAERDFLYELLRERQDHRRVAAAAGARSRPGRGRDPRTARRRDAAMIADDIAPDGFYAIAAGVPRLHPGHGPGAVPSAARRLGGRHGRRGAIDQGHRREPLQGGEHGGRGRHRRRHQRARRPRISLRVRRRRRELRGAAARRRRWRARRWPRPPPGCATISISRCASAWCGSRTSARRASTCASRAMRRRRTSRSRCLPAAASPGRTRR